MPTYIQGSAMPVSRWGNSLTIRLPAVVIEALGLKEGDAIDIHVTGDRSFAIEKAPAAQELLARWRKYRGRLPAGFTFDRLDAHGRGLVLAERYGFSIDDSLIVAAASLAGCRILYSEDMHDGQTIDTVTIRAGRHRRQPDIGPDHHEVNRMTEDRHVAADECENPGEAEARDAARKARVFLKTCASNSASCRRSARSRGASRFRVTPRLSPPALRHRSHLGLEGIPCGLRDVVAV